MVFLEQRPLKIAPRTELGGEIQTYVFPPRVISVKKEISLFFLLYGTQKLLKYIKCASIVSTNRLNLFSPQKSGKSLI